MSPIYAGALRGLGIAVATAIIDYLIANLSNIEPASLVVYQPLILLGLRTIEGVIDHARQPAP